MISDSKRKAYHSIVAFLKGECACTEYSSDIVESLEGLLSHCNIISVVAKQCIESAFGVSGDSKPELDLLALFEKPSSVSD